MEKKCEHPPFDRDVDENENVCCSICGEIITLAEDRETEEELQRDGQRSREPF